MHESTSRLNSLRPDKNEDSQALQVTISNLNTFEKTDLFHDSQYSSLTRSKAMTYEKLILQRQNKAKGTFLQSDTSRKDIFNPLISIFG